MDILADIPSDSDVSGVDDDSDLDETFRPRGEEASSDSEDEVENVTDLVEVPGPYEDVQDDDPGPYGDASAAVLPHVPDDAQAVKRRRVSGKKVTQREWFHADLPVQEMPASTVTPRGIADSDNEVQMFMKLFGSNNISLLTTQTNLVRVQNSISRNKPVPPISEREIRQAIGILMYMSVVSMPNIRLYWKNNLRNEMVAGVMSRDRFLLIVACLHLSDNSLQPGRDSPAYDRLYKVQIFVYFPSTHHPAQHPQNTKHSYQNII